MNLTLVTPPASEPVTVDEVKLHTRIDDDFEEALLQLWIVSARIQAEDFQHRAYITQVRELSFDYFPRLPICLPRSPVQEVTSFKYYDYQNTETVFSLDNLLIDTDSEPARITLSYGILYPSVTLRAMNAVKIRYTAGYGDSASDVPQTVTEAIMLYCTHRYDNRDAEKPPAEFFNMLRPDRVHL